MSRRGGAGVRENGRAGGPPEAPEPLPIPVVDAHCHLDIMGSATPEAVAEAVAAAQAVGVGRVVTIGVDVATSQWSAEAAAGHPDVYAGVAIHPNEAYLSTDDALDEIARLARLPRVRAVGETGPRLLPRHGDAGAAAALVPAAHRDRQGVGQGAGHPRPRCSRRRAADPA